MFTTGSIVLAILLAWLDERLLADVLPALFRGGPDGARSVLSTVASSMITLTALVFSITIVVLQLTSSQFSPRVLQKFLSDRLTQVTLGVFIATFVYALTVLRSVRGTESRNGQFVPQTALTMSFLFVLLSVAVFIVYINHIANFIQVSRILASVGAETRRLVERRLTSSEPPPPFPPFGPLIGTIDSPRSGSVTWVREAPVVRAARAAGCLLVLVPRIGDFVATGMPLFHVHAGPATPALPETHGSGSAGHLDSQPPADLDAGAVTRAVGLSVERTMHQDVAFGFRQLADIAERALSPSINDETTAIQAVDEIHDVLRRIVLIPRHRRVHSDDESRPRLVVPEHGLEDFLRISVEGIGRHARSSPRVLSRLRAMMLDLRRVACSEHRSLLLRYLELASSPTQDRGNDQ